MKDCIIEFIGAFFLNLGVGLIVIDWGRHHRIKDGRQKPGECLLDDRRNMIIIHIL